MLRTVFATAVLALLAASAHAASIPDVTPTYHRFHGAPAMTFSVANGPDAHAVTADEYAAFRASGSCRRTSHATVWDPSDQSKIAISVVCEL